MGPGAGLLDGREAYRRDAEGVLLVASVAHACRHGLEVRGVACQGIHASVKSKVKITLNNILSIFQ